MNNKFSRFFVIIFMSAAIAAQSSAAFEFNLFQTKRDYLYLVGSSTVSPFMAAVAEEFNRMQSLNNPNAKMPVVESDGSSGGFNMFCAGMGYEYADFANASRVMRENEIAECSKNGVDQIVEVKIGYDGIVLANSMRSKKMQLSREQIFLALAEKIYDVKSAKIINNPYHYWSEIDSKLPKKKITVYGPPLTSGTRDVFVDIVLEEVCFMKKEFIAAFPDRDIRRRQCRRIRSDGNFIESGENDNVIVRQIKDNRDALGIFGFNFLAVNQQIVQAASIDGVYPSFETIASKKYELSRPLFVYFKKEHLKLMPQMADFIKEMVSSETIGPKGYLVNSGLIALSDKEQKEIEKNVLDQIAEVK